MPSATSHSTSVTPRGDLNPERRSLWALGEGEKRFAGGGGCSSPFPRPTRLQGSKVGRGGGLLVGGGGGLGPAGGGGSPRTPTYMAQNDRLVALIILSHVW